MVKNSASGGNQGIFFRLDERLATYQHRVEPLLRFRIRSITGSRAGTFQSCLFPVRKNTRDGCRKGGRRIQIGGTEKSRTRSVLRAWPLHAWIGPWYELPSWGPLRRSRYSRFEFFALQNRNRYCLHHSKQFQRAVPIVRGKNVYLVRLECARSKAKGFDQPVSLEWKARHVFRLWHQTRAANRIRQRHNFLSDVGRSGE